MAVKARRQTTPTALRWLDSGAWIPIVRDELRGEKRNKETSYQNNKRLSL